MAQPLTLTALIAYGTPVVNGDEVVLPAEVADAQGVRSWIGLKADRRLFRRLASELIEANARGQQSAGRTGGRRA